MSEPIKAFEVINCGLLDEPVNPKSETQVATWVLALLKTIRIPLPVRPGFTEQATIDGALLAAATLAEEHVRRRLPHKPAKESADDTAALAKRLNNLVADYIEQQTKFKGN